MAEAHPNTLGQDLEDQLFAALHDAQHAPLPGARDLPILQGITPKFLFIEPVENVLAKLRNIVTESGGVYTCGNSIVIENDAGEPGQKRLTNLYSLDKVEPGAENQLANLFVCQCGSGNGVVQFPPSHRLASVFLTNHTLRSALPRIRVYAKRSLFDENFVLRDPGWHSDVGMLIHGPAIDPILFTPPSTTGPALDRLPPRLKTLLSGFCFRSDADVVNAVALLLTGLLINLFVATGKALGLIDGNQRDTGKSWLVRTIAMVLDGIDPATIPYTSDDEELEKKLCAKLREFSGSVLLFDNAKTRGDAAVSSPLIEALSVAPEISIRILGVSENYTRPNDVLWTLTMNTTLASPDMISRGLPIQLYFEGRTEDRVFNGPNPMDFARQHRLEILGELAGMVIRWVQDGRPKGTQPHRLHYWAEIIGGILAVAGLPEFLANAQETAAEFNSESEEQAALAESVIAENGPFVVDDSH